MENIEWWVRTSDGAYLSQPVTLFVDVTSQHHLCVVHEGQDNATNLYKKNESYQSVSYFPDCDKIYFVSIGQMGSVRRFHVNDDWTKQDSQSNDR